MRRTYEPRRGDRDTCDPRFARDTHRVYRHLADRRVARNVQQPLWLPTRRIVFHRLCQAARLGLRRSAAVDRTRHEPVDAAVRRYARGVAHSAGALRGCARCAGVSLRRAIGRRHLCGARGRGRSGTGAVRSRHRQSADDERVRTALLARIDAARLRATRFAPRVASAGNRRHCWRRIPQ
jgi:hypothetical protein